MHGRTVIVRKLLDTQIMLLAREAKILQRDDISNTRKLDGIDRMFSILESVVISEDDQMYMQDLMVKGELDLRELITFVTAFNTDDDGVEKPARVRRGRTPAKR